MAQYIDKDKVAEEIKKRKSELQSRIAELGTFESNTLDLFQDADLYDDILSFLDTLEVKEVEECKQPEHSCLKTIYQCGKNPHWNIGDTLAYYEFYSDREGEHVLGKVIKAEFDEEQCDWFYTFEHGSIYDEQSLLENQTYKKN